MTENLRFRDPNLAKLAVRKIWQQADSIDSARICHVCGTHEWTITHYGLRSLLPGNVEVIAGPGCPVCIVPASEIDEAVQIALKGIVVTCFGDLIRVPGSRMSLLEAKAKGADVRVVYSVSDAVRMAENEQDKEFVFFAVGFETTAPSTAVELLHKPSRNLSFLVSHRVIPPAMQLLVSMKDLKLSGFIAPGHVSTIIGLDPYRVLPEKYKMPVVVAGFEPLDLLLGVYLLLRQVSSRKPSLENEYVRAVRPEGNRRAQRILRKIFTTADGRWRGLGIIRASKYTLNETFEEFDARLRHNVQADDGIDLQQGCQCHLVIIGKIKPTACPLFMKKCTPQNPIGACMVSTEGTCRIWGNVERTADMEFGKVI